MAKTGEFEVEQILGKRTRNGEVKYKIRWKGFNESDDTWEPEKNLTHCQDLLTEYNKEKERDVTIIGQMIANSPHMNGSLLQSPLFTSTPGTIERITKKESNFAKNRGYHDGHQRKDAMPFQSYEESKSHTITELDDRPANPFFMCAVGILLLAALFYKLFTNNASS